MAAHITFDQQAIAEFCRRNCIRRLSLFGSVLRDDFRPDSDVDVLVEFEPNAPVGYLDMARMERELSAMLHRDVDMRTPKEISRYFRDQVLASCELQYAAE